jgi:hypothetical protein
MANHCSTPPSDLWEAFSYDPLNGDLYRLTGPKKGLKAACLRKDGYTVVWHKGKLYLAHRLIYTWCSGHDPGDLFVDHVDRNQKNNRYWNLRTATPAQSSFNTAGMGIQQRKNGKYSVRISKNYKNYGLGTYETYLEAVAAYKAASAVLHGDFGCAS